MGLVTKMLERAAPTQASAAASRPLSARLSLAIWIVVMSILWVLVAAGVSALLGIEF
ncbi:hypothetical protein JL100_000095 [Skermanella mucosa]|uniref:hypothetical protein n=1 Tax=Skermanella mucosa TaxID=1789672 RepID=UPI00192B156F|nr:hypothetical protein [Skermanella mucosa]UEM21237.1 hypothetical protein JL100_000095 [Skermanella mucosa]